MSGTHYVNVCQRKRGVSVATRVEMGLRIRDKKCTGRRREGYKDKNDKSEEGWREKKGRMKLVVRWWRSKEVAK